MSPLLIRFDRLYLLNLPERTDRRLSIEKQLARIGLSLSSERVVLFPAIAPTDAGGFPTIGARGCFLSHLAILEQAEACGLNAIAVMEDDLCLSNDVNARLQPTLDALDATTWDMTYLGHNESTQGPEPLQPLAFDNGICCTHFYAISPVMRRAFIQFLHEVLTRENGDPLGGPMHVDGAYSFFRSKHPEFVTLLANPSLGYQGASRSDITAQWFDRVPALRIPVALLRRARALLKKR